MVEYIYDRNRRRNGRGFLRVLLGAVLGSLLGGLLVLYSLPLIYPDLFESGEFLLPQPQNGRIQENEKIESPLAGGTVVDIVDQAGPTVVGVVSRQVLRDFWTGREYERTPGGSGVFIDPRGYIITNYHVIEGAQEVIVSLQDGRTMEAEIAGIDPPTDLAVLKVGDGQETFPYSQFADSDRIKVGELAVAIGNPISMRFQRSVTVGVVSGIRDTLYGQHEGIQRVFQLVQTDASINPGNSGGPLLDGRAEIIGINTLKIGAQDVEGMGFAIPSNTVKRIASDLIEMGHVRRAWMGISVLGADEARQRLRVDIPDGVFIADISSESPADQAGMKAGDVIVEINGKPVRETVDLLVFLEHSYPGDEAVFTVKREDSRMVFTPVLGVMPQYWDR